MSSRYYFGLGVVIVNIGVLQDTVWHLPLDRCIHSILAGIACMLWGIFVRLKEAK